MAHTQIVHMLVTLLGLLFITVRLQLHVCELFVWKDPVLIWTNTEAVDCYRSNTCTKIENTATFGKVAIKAVVIVSSPS